MKEQSGETYQSGDFAKALAVAESKVGKTTFLVASALGVLPWQKFGGVVDKPENLHVIALDSGAVSGVSSFLKMCDAPAEAYKFRVYNMQDDVRRISTAESDWDYSFFNNMVQTIKKIQDRCKSGSPMVIVSSLTTLALTLERALAGAPGDSAKKGAGMDQSKWTDYARQLNEVRNLLQQDSWHMLWEGHVYKPPNTGQNKKAEDDRKETIQVSGKAGYNFPNNVEQIFRLRRMFGDTYENTKIERVFLDTRPTMDFIAGGRSFTENLDPKEHDLTLAFYKLGLKVGRWGSKSSKKKQK